MSDYFIRSGRRVTGPFSSRQIREMASAGTLVETDEVSKDKARWVAAREIPNLIFQAKTPARVERVARVSVIEPTESRPPITSSGPVIQMHASPVIQVNAPTPHGNSLGIASMVLGILAFVICWIPVINLLSLPLSGLGVVLGIIGIVIAATRRGSGIGFPIAGTAISGLALIVVIWMYLAIASAMAPLVPSQQPQPTFQLPSPPPQAATSSQSGRNSQP